MEEISLRDYIWIMKKRLWVIIALTVIPMIISCIVSFYGGKTEPEYNASTTLIVGGPKAYLNSENQVDYDAYKAINGKFITNFNELLKTEVIADEVIDNLNLNMTYEEFNEKINVELIENTAIIKIEAKDKDPDLAVKIVDEIVAVSLGKASKLMNIENIEVMNKTQVKAIPLKSKTATNVVISGGVGFVVSLFLVLLLDYLDNTIKTPKDIERYLQLPVSGIVPETEDGLIICKKPNSIVSEFYRALRTNIQKFKTEKGIKSILITSSNPNEGKSTIAVNIAMSIAQTKEKVLIIDGNMRKPQIHTLFEIDNKLGLSNVLKENMDYRKVIRESKGEKNLHILTSGSSISNPAELLASKSMKDLLKKASNEYNTVVINSPALGAMSDASILSTIVDGTILVCTADQSDIDNAKMAKKLLEKVDANILGVVLNRVDLKREDYYKYYYNSYMYYGNNSNIERVAKSKN